MIDFDEVAFKLAKAEAGNKVLQYELERTRKSLNTAVVALKFVANTALEQITALEQKDIK